MRSESHLDLRIAQLFGVDGLAVVVFIIKLPQLLALISKLIRSAKVTTLISCCLS